MAILVHLTRPLFKVTHHFSNTGLFKTSMPNFSQICSEMTILAHLSKLTDQPTNHFLYRYYNSMNYLNSPFFYLEAIWKVSPMHGLPLCMGFPSAWVSPLCTFPLWQFPICAHFPSVCIIFWLRPTGRPSLTYGKQKIIIWIFLHFTVKPHSCILTPTKISLWSLNS